MKTAYKGMAGLLYIAYNYRDREHATILATNFPIDTNEDQLRHFFREVLPPVISLFKSVVWSHTATQ